MRRIRAKLTYANVISTLALFLVLAGGTALAATMITSNSQVGQGVISGHKPPSGKHANIIGGSINGQDIANDSLGGSKILESSLAKVPNADKLDGVDSTAFVDKCPASATTRFGALCVRSENENQPFGGALNLCANLDMHLPSWSEATTLATHDIPNIDGTEVFWTEDIFLRPADAGTNQGEFKTFVLDDAGTPTEEGIGGNPESQVVHQTVCVTTPTN